MLDQGRRILGWSDPDSLFRLGYWSECKGYFKMLVTVLNQIMCKGISMITSCKEVIKFWDWSRSCWILFDPGSMSISNSAKLQDVRHFLALEESWTAWVLFVFQWSKYYMNGCLANCIMAKWGLCKISVGENVISYQNSQSSCKKWLEIKIEILPQKGPQIKIHFENLKSTNSKS